MTKDPEIELARLRDRPWELDNELFETETKLNKAIKSISEGLDTTGELQQIADELMRKATEQQAQLRKMDEESALAEAKW